MLISPFHGKVRFISSAGPTAKGPGQAVQCTVYSTHTDYARQNVTARQMD